MSNTQIPRYWGRQGAMAPTFHLKSTFFQKSYPFLQFSKPLLGPCNPKSDNKNIAKQHNSNSLLLCYENALMRKAVYIHVDCPLILF